MVDLKQAIKAASDFAYKLLGPQIEELLLEEAELSESRRKWKITLGFTRRLPSRDGKGDGEANLAFLARASSRREYKVFRVDAKNGEVLSMRIRK